MTIQNGEGTGSEMLRITEFEEHYENKGKRNNC